MAILQLKEMVPETYTEQSRDFQLLEHLYDCVINGVKLDIDSMQYLTDTRTCRNSVLQLLSNKVGFLTSKQFDNESLRIVLSAFPIIVKNKGSLLGIKQAIQTYFKAIKLVTDFSIEYDEVSKSLVIIKIRSSVKDTSLLDEILKYVLPAGCSIRYEFYNIMSATGTNISQNQYTKNISIERSAAGQVRSSIISDYNGVELNDPDDFHADDATHRLIGAVDTFELISKADIDKVDKQTAQYQTFGSEVIEGE